VVLAIARELALKINAEPGMKAVLTRNGDYFVPLRDRMRRARAQQRICSFPFTPIPSAIGASTVPRCTSCRSGARPTKRRAGWPSVKTLPT
jgi:hypothetical protein